MKVRTAEQIITRTIKEGGLMLKNKKVIRLLISVAVVGSLVSALILGACAAPNPTPTPTPTPTPNPKKNVKKHRKIKD